MPRVRIRWHYLITIGVLMLAALRYVHQGYILSSSDAQTLTLRRHGRARSDESVARDCRLTSCFTINRCAHRKQGKIGVYISPLYSFVDEVARTTFVPDISVEYAELLDAIRVSPYYEPDLTKACVLVPHIDTLNAANSVDVDVIFDMLNSLPEWANGENHILFVMFPSAQTNSFFSLDSGRAVVAGTGFTKPLYRAGLDVSIPAFNHLTFDIKYPARAIHNIRLHLLTVLNRAGSLVSDRLDTAFHGDTRSLLLQLCPDSMVPPTEMPWKRCTHNHEVLDYPSVLLSSRFCLVGDIFEFTDVMMCGCIPVLLEDDIILPFSEGIDWSRASVRLWREELDHMVLEKLQSYPEEEMRQQVLFLYQKYFSSMSAIALTVMAIINERVFPSHVQSYESWNNGPVHSIKSYDFQCSRTRLLSNTLSTNGFTAVLIVTSVHELLQVYDVIQSIAMATDLAKILVIWTDTSKPFPPEYTQPHVAPPIKFITPPNNSWNYRFFPYTEIDTAAVLVFSTYSTPLTSIDVQFGYKIWARFPDMQVHVGHSSSGDNVKHSPLVIGGKGSTVATFQHAFYHYLYTHEMPRAVAQWLSQHADCHDIAMELLITNYTGQPPIKVRSMLMMSAAAMNRQEEDSCTYLLSYIWVPPLIEPGSSLLFDVSVGHVP